MEKEYNPNNDYKINPVYVKIRSRLHDSTIDYERKFKERPNKEKLLKLIRFTIYTYFKYFNAAIANGYPINIRWGTTIQLEKEEIRKLDIKEKSRYFTSSRVFGWMFKIVYKDKIARGKETTMLFYPHEMMSNVLQDNLNSDIIYELLKP